MVTLYNSCLLCTLIQLDVYIDHQFKSQFLQQVFIFIVVLIHSWHCLPVVELLKHNIKNSNLHLCFSTHLVEHIFQNLLSTSPSILPYEHSFRLCY